MYIYHVLINAPSTHMIHINPNTIFYTHIEHNPTKTIYIRYCKETHTQTQSNVFLASNKFYKVQDQEKYKQ